MQNKRKLYIVNIPRQLTQLELINALRMVYPAAKVRLYRKGEESMGCGDVTFQSEIDCQDFLQQLKVRPFVLFGMRLKFSYFRDPKRDTEQDGRAEEQQEPPPSKIKLVAYLPPEQQGDDPARLLKEYQAQCKHVYAVIKKPIIIDSQEADTCNLWVNLSGTAMTAAEAAGLFRGYVRPMIRLDVKDDEQMSRYRIIVHNLPNCSDDYLVQSLHSLFGRPFKHVKRVKNYCFVTFYETSDIVEVVRHDAGVYRLGRREIVCDFISDSMRSRYGAVQVPDNKHHEPSSQQDDTDRESVSVSVSSDDHDTPQQRVEIEQYDERKGVDYYLAPQKDSEAEAAGQGEARREQESEYEQLANFVQENPVRNPVQQKPSPQERDYDGDQFTLFVHNLPQSLPLDVINKEAEMLQQKHIAYRNQNHLIAMTVRRELFDLFRRFGELRKLIVPMDQTDRMKGTAFVQFYNKEDYETCVAYIKAMQEQRQIHAHDNVGGRQNHSTYESQVNTFRTGAKHGFDHKQFNIHSALINEVRHGDVQDDMLLQQQQASNMMNGYQHISTQHLYKELDAIKKINHRLIDLQAGQFRIYGENIIVFEYMSKKELEKFQATKDERSRRIDLIRVGALIPGVLSSEQIKELKISTQDLKIRQNHYNRLKRLAENVNYHANPLRVEARNFDKKAVTEEGFMVALWCLFVQKCQYSRQDAAHHLPGHLDLLDPKTAAKQRHITQQQMTFLAKTLKISAIRMPRPQTRCYEILRNFQQIQALESGPTIGVVYFDMESEESAKKLVEFLNNADMFGTPDKRIICNFCLENVKKIMNKANYKQQKSKLMEQRQREENAQEGNEKKAKQNRKRRATVKCAE